MSWKIDIILDEDCGKRKILDDKFLRDILSRETEKILFFGKRRGN